MEDDGPSIYYSYGDYMKARVMLVIRSVNRRCRV